MVLNNSTNISSIRFPYLQNIRSLILGLWGVAALLAVILIGQAVDTGWATALLRWGFFAGPLAVLTYVVTYKTVGSISTQHLIWLGIVWVVAGSVAYAMQYGIFDWIVELASSPSNSSAFRVFVGLEHLVHIIEFMVSLSLCIWMIRRTWATILDTAVHENVSK